MESGSGHLPQNGMEDATVSVVLHLDRCIDPGLGLERLLRSVRAGAPHGDLLERLDIGWQVDVEGLLTGQAQGIGILTNRELQGQNPHEHQVGTVNALEALGDDRLHAQQVRTLRSPVAARGS